MPIVSDSSFGLLARGCDTDRKVSVRSAIRDDTEYPSSLPTVLIGSDQSFRVSVASAILELIVSPRSLPLAASHIRYDRRIRNILPYRVSIDVNRAVYLSNISRLSSMLHRSS